LKTETSLFNSVISFPSSLLKNALMWCSIE